MTYLLKFRKGVRGTEYRQLVTSEATIMVEAKQRDLVFEHRGPDAPILRDLDKSKTIINEMYVDKEWVSEFGAPEPKVELTPEKLAEEKATGTKETVEQIAARVAAAKKAE
jgi:hypothetical protein